MGILNNKSEEQEKQEEQEYTDLDDLDDLDDLEDLEDIEDVEDDVKSDILSNTLNIEELNSVVKSDIINIGKNKKEAGRPKGSRTDNKARILRQLKKVWENSKNKHNEIIAAASLYAELQGYKQKNPNDSAINKEILKVEFVIDYPKTLNDNDTQNKQNSPTILSDSNNPLSDSKSAQVSNPLSNSKPSDSEVSCNSLSEKENSALVISKDTNGGNLFLQDLPPLLNNSTKIIKNSNDSEILQNLKTSKNNLEQEQLVEFKQSNVPKIAALKRKIEAQIQQERLNKIISRNQSKSSDISNTSDLKEDNELIVEGLHNKNSKRYFKDKDKVLEIIKDAALSNSKSAALSKDNNTFTASDGLDDDF